MRIRSIKPEFWRSSDISSLDWEARLLFIGLWSYVDDNGVGIDKLSAIVADLFADDVESDARETFARVSRGLQTLSDEGRITRYKVDRRQFLCITNWDRHQRIDKPNKARYPLPTCDDAEIRESVASIPRDLRETPAPGTGEQGNRGTGEQTLSSGKPDTPDRFAEFYDKYPRKEGRGQAAKAWKAALKKTDADTIINGLTAQLPTMASTERRFIKLPTTWLNGECWDDEQQDVEEHPYAHIPRPTTDWDALRAEAEASRNSGGAS